MNWLLKIVVFFCFGSASYYLLYATGTSEELFQPNFSIFILYFFLCGLGASYGNIREILMQSTSTMAGVVFVLATRAPPDPLVGLASVIAMAAIVSGAGFAVFAQECIHRIQQE